eukprot:SAG11_NODE_2548_length_3231_cov_14.685504_3_plen_436_part_00
MGRTARVHRASATAAAPAGLLDDPSFQAFDARLARDGRALPATSYDIDLDQSPAERWGWVVAYRSYFNQARALVVDEFLEEDGGTLPAWLRLGARALLACVPAERRAEVEACALACDVPPAELALVNYLYELKAKCSSFVVSRTDGRPLHARTLDWPGCAVLSACTVRLRVLRGGRLLYEAVSWPGYLGVLTAVVPGRFSVSVNFREDERAAASMAAGGAPGSLTDMARRSTAMLGAFARRGRSVGFAVRALLEGAEPRTFEQAVEELRRVELVAPVYFILAGVRRDEGAVLVRAPQRSDADGWRCRRLGEPSCTHNGLLYQANADLPVCFSSRSPEFKALKRAEERAEGLYSWDRIAAARALAGRHTGGGYSLADVIDMVTSCAPSYTPAHTAVLAHLGRSRRVYSARAASISASPFSASSLLRCDPTQSANLE